MYTLVLVVWLVCGFSQDADMQKPEVSLVGSHESQRWQNKKADDAGLERFENSRALQKAKKSGELVPLPNNKMISIDGRLKKEWRWCRPWTRDLLNDLAQAHLEAFHKKVFVNSAVRTVEKQRRLRRHNANAAEIEGDEASSHLTGATIDIGKKGMSADELEWMREQLLRYEERDLIEVTEEFHQSVFHFMVFKEYQ